MPKVKVEVVGELTRPPTIPDHLYAVKTERGETYYFRQDNFEYETLEPDPFVEPDWAVPGTVLAADAWIWVVIVVDHYDVSGASTPRLVVACVNQSNEGPTHVEAPSAVEEFVQRYPDYAVVFDGSNRVMGYAS